MSVFLPLTGSPFGALPLAVALYADHSIKPRGMGVVFPASSQTSKSDPVDFPGGGERALWLQSQVSGLDLDLNPGSGLFLDEPSGAVCSTSHSCRF